MASRDIHAVATRAACALPVQLYYCTSYEAARAILVDGFSDESAAYWSGVCLHDSPYDSYDEPAEALLEVIPTLPRQLLDSYGSCDDERLYRTYLLPAALVNKYGAVRLVEDVWPSGR